MGSMKSVCPQGAYSFWHHFGNVVIQSYWTAKVEEYETRTTRHVRHTMKLAGVEGMLNIQDATDNAFKNAEDCASS